jgi:predicted ATPase
MKRLSLFSEIKTNRLSGGRYEMLVKTKPKGTYTSLSDVGFGVSQFLPIIVADIQLGDDSNLIVAQPEIHLHPNVQALFGDYIVDQMRDCNKNYILETHSEYLLNRLRLLITNGKLEEQDISVYFIDDEKDLNLYKLEFKRNGQILNAPENFFKTYMMDVMDIALNAVK